MKLANRHPVDPEVTARILKRVSRMTPEEIMAFLEYRTPGIEETDTTGMLSPAPKANLAIRARPNSSAA